jgi:hypothetical protein
MGRRWRAREAIAGNVRVLTFLPGGTEGFHDAAYRKQFFNEHGHSEQPNARGQGLESPVLLALAALLFSSQNDLLHGYSGYRRHRTGWLMIKLVKV